MQPYLLRNNVKIAPFKTTEIEPYGAFANTTAPGKYPIRQTINIDGKSTTINWPSSEHAFHAQKILHLKEKLGATHPAQQTLTKMLYEIAATNKEYLPRENYDPLVNKYIPELNQKGLSLTDKKSFDALCDADYHAQYNPQGGRETSNFMRKVVQLKLEQHPNLRATAMACAREGIMPVEVSRFDVNWASGPNGKGENLLGIIILEEGNKLLRQAGEQPAIPNPSQAYHQIKQNQDLSHDALVGVLKPQKNTWVIPSKFNSPQAPNTFNKWDKLNARAAQSNPDFILFKPEAAINQMLSKNEIEKALKKGTIPFMSDNQSILDRYLCSQNNGYKQDAADIVGQYSVKGVMGNINIPVNIQAVDNTRANISGHDSHAIAVKFNSQQEAQLFCEKLFKEHGIYSHTHGAGVMKTPQNGAVFLTKKDIEKISHLTHLSKQAGTGELAYQTLVNTFENSKLNKNEPDKSHHSNASFSP